MTDAETGETACVPCYNLETGEEELNLVAPESRGPRRAFRIPNNYKKPPNIIEKSVLTYANAGKSVTPIIFMLIIPTVLHLFKLSVIFLFIFETALHAWTHKLNNKMKNTNERYQSPLYIVTKEYCPFCLEESQKDNIIKMHRKHNIAYGIDYLKTVVS